MAPEPHAAASEVITDADRPPPPRRRGGVMLVLIVAGLAVGGLGAAAVVGDGPTQTPAAQTGAVADPSPTLMPPEEAAAAIASVQRREEGDPFALGRVDAPVVMVEFSDWRCPFCARFARDTKPELQRFVDDGTLRIEYRDLPVGGEESMRAARAGRAAGAQGRFWEYYAALFAAAPEGERPDTTLPALRDYADAAGIPDLARFETDLRDVSLDAQIERDIEDARRLGAPSSVPLFLIGDEGLSGAQPTEVFVEIIERQAQKVS
ncbi:MAG: thioredoxin domain-containing protein [Mobilicoccus sp.]|nr:thioredoxin domain-containing protein [Mobilicoccus sp.]